MWNRELCWIMGIWASTHGEFIMKQRMRLEEANPGLAEEQAACMYIVTSTIQILMLSFAAFLHIAFLPYHYILIDLKICILDTRP